MSSESLQSLQSSFARALRVEGKADRTITIYTDSIVSFTAWLHEAHQGADLDALSRDNVLEWLNHLRGTGRSPATVITRWQGMRRFANWLLAEDFVEDDPLAGITVDKPEPPPVPIFTDDELTALVGACTGKGFRERRDELVIRMLVDCGLRVSELTGIDVEDLDLDGQTVTVTGKGNGVRKAYYGARTALALDRYLRVRTRHDLAGLAALFIGERGGLRPDGVRHRLKVRAEMAGLDPATVNPHRFRHTNAHDFLLAGGQERDLKRLMGWRSDAMLERYGASAADHRAREAARRLKRGDRI
ncbi:MAG TPA: tyrosine-type recombinase/integrase [Mycobacterium sp.]|nr:tyrosine-type recombinase/integrase [Mycobacterium sp.]